MPAVSDFITAKKIKLLLSLLAFFTDKSGFVEVIEIAKPWLPLTRVTPHSVGRCHEVTEGTAAVSGCRAKRD